MSVHDDYVQVKFYASPELRAALREYAQTNDRTVGAEIRRIIREYLKAAGALPSGRGSEEA